MIYPEILTSSSDINYPYIINDVKYIYECARVTKQKYIYVSKKDNCLYMTSDKYCGIHIVKLPFQANSDMIIYMGYYNSSVFENHENFFIAKEFPLALIPEYYWDKYKAGEIVETINLNNSTFELIDKTILQPIECIYMTTRYIDCKVSGFLNMINNYLNGLCNWYNPTLYTDFQKNEKLIEGFFNQKTIYGNFLINLYKHDRCREIPVTFFKGMVALNKSDKMDIELFSNRNRKDIYLLALHPRKNKNPIKENKYLNSFYEDVYYAIKEI